MKDLTMQKCHRIEAIYFKTKKERIKKKQFSKIFNGTRRYFHLWSNSLEKAREEAERGYIVMPTYTDLVARYGGK